MSVTGTVRAGDYTVLYAKVKENHHFETGFLVHHRIISAVKRVEFVSNHQCKWTVLMGRFTNRLITY